MRPDPEIGREQVRIDDQQPWAGLRSFTEKDESYFQGRDRESADLFRLVRRGALTVVYGASGLGKTSLLEAGLFPKLRQELFFPVSIRLDFEHHAGDLVRHVFRRVAEEAGDGQHPVEAPDPREDETLWEYFHRAEFWDPAVRLLTPVLVFDQFEELFTLGRADARVEPFLQELADLIENCIPERDARRFDDLEATLPFLLERQDYKVILSLREDYLAQLDDHKPLIPSLAHGRYRLKALDGHHALEAILEPAAKLDLVARDVALEILRLTAEPQKLEVSDHELEETLADLDFEPAILSLFCFELNRRRVKESRQRITKDLVKGARGRIISSFYDNSFAGMRPEVQVWVEDHLLTDQGFRRAADRAEAEADGITEDEINTLVKGRLLRGEPRFGRPHVELIHDILRDEVRSRRDQRRDLRLRRKELEAAAARQHELEKEAAVQKEQLRRARRRAMVLGLLTAAALAFAVFGISMWQRAKSARDKAAENARIAILNKDAAETAAKQAEESAKDALAAQGRANEERQTAIDERLKAETARDDAQKAEVRAEQERLLAEEQKQLAEEQKQLAEEQKQLADDAAIAAIAARAQALKDKEAAETAERKLTAEKARRERLQLLKFSRDLAAKSLEMLELPNQRQTAAFLALEAYSLDRGNQKDPSSPLQLPPEIFDAVRQALDSVRKDEQDTPPQKSEVLRQEGQVRTLALSPDGLDLFTGSDDGRVYWYRRDRAPPEIGCTQLASAVRAVALSPNGHLLAVGTAAGGIQIWQLPSEPPEADPSLPVVPECQGGVGLLPAAVDVLTEEEIPVARARIRSFRALAFADDETLVSAYRLCQEEQPMPGCGNLAAELLVWRGGPRGWQLPDRYPLTPPLDVTALALDPRAPNTLTVASREGVTQLEIPRELEPAELALEPDEAYPKDVSSLAYGPEGILLALGLRNGEVAVWNSQSPSAGPSPVAAHSSAVTALSFSPGSAVPGDRCPGSSYLASTSLDGTVKIRPVSQTDGQTIVIEDHQGWVWDVAFQSEGCEIVYAGADGTVRWWSLQISDLIREICAILRSGPDSEDSGKLEEWEKAVWEEHVVSELEKRLLPVPEQTPRCPEPPESRPQDGRSQR